MGERLLTTNDVRKHMRCSSQTVTNLINLGMLPVIRFGRTCRIRNDALEKFLSTMEGKDVQEEIEKRRVDMKIRCNEGG